MFVEPARSERARRALMRAIGSRRFEFFSGCLAFIRTAHYWTVLHPEIESEDDMLSLLRDQKELAKLLLGDSEADRCEMGERLFEELSALRDLHERQELEKAKRALEEKDRQKDQFIAVLAHELRNPLATIRGSAELLARIKVPDDRIVLIGQRLERQATAMVRMLDDLLDESRMALERCQFNGAVGVQELLNEVLEEQRVRIAQAGLNLEVRVDDNPCSVNADRVRLRQIVDNLFSNAIKFTKAGGSIHLCVVKESSFACISVRDTGVGFDQQFATKLFEPFTQAEQERSRPRSGLGLGLSIASRLAKLAGRHSLSRERGNQSGSDFHVEAFARRLNKS